MKELNTVFSKLITIPGTLKYHTFIPNANGQLQLKKFSFATRFGLILKKTANPAFKKQENTQKRDEQLRLLWTLRIMHTAKCTSSCPMPACRQKAHFNRATYLRYYQPSHFVFTGIWCKKVKLSFDISFEKIKDAHLVLPRGIYL